LLDTQYLHQRSANDEHTFIFFFFFPLCVVHVVVVGSLLGTNHWWFHHTRSWTFWKWPADQRKRYSIIKMALK
jgi:hypothetical protein